MDIHFRKYFQSVIGRPLIINPDLAPILLHIGAKPEVWMDTVTRFDEKFHVAAGTHSSFKKFAAKIGVRWLVDKSTARGSFQ
jgi:hypothetical protein